MDTSYQGVISWLSAPLKYQNINVLCCESSNPRSLTFSKHTKMMLSFHMFFTHLEAVKRLLYDNYSWHFQLWYCPLLSVSALCCQIEFIRYFSVILVTYFSMRVICVDTVSVHGYNSADTFLQLIHSPGFHEKLPLRWLTQGVAGAVWHLPPASNTIHISLFNILRPWYLIIFSYSPSEREKRNAGITFVADWTGQGSLAAHPPLDTLAQR